MRRPSVLIVGGGASGVILAAHLLRRPDPPTSVTVIEKRPALGRGIAYSTTEPDHLLNVRAANMSALADEPGHFARWLEGRGVGGKDFSAFYAPRMLYGDYLGALAETLPGASERLRHMQGTCLGLDADGEGVSARLADGSRLHADAAVLAAGHEENPLKERPYAMRFTGGREPPLDGQAAVLILGTGLSMVDAWLSLEARGHRGPVIALSRRGLLPTGHSLALAPVRFTAADLPLGEPPGAVLRWLRDTVCGVELMDGDWRSAVDGLRPFNQAIWQSWDEAGQRRFLRHAKTPWHIHRHRMAPAVFQRMEAARAGGRLRVLAGRLQSVSKAAEGWEARIRLKGACGETAFSAARILDCSGVATDPAQSSNPLIRNLLESGAARPDPMRIGLDVTPDCRLVNRDGAPSDRLSAIGPLTRGTFLEIEAVPDIRLQCAALAERLTR